MQASKQRRSKNKKLTKMSRKGVGIIELGIANADGNSHPIHPRAELHREITILCLTNFCITSPLFRSAP
jgi:hypothetical protein